ncbi:MAG: hypothetical protein PF638_06810 [Candidatus Delongbacteria bacterium]|jgi:hypothetical protein|nr:hypothetical protein [Candidatus Delongbacteria bacterium]
MISFNKFINSSNFYFKHKIRGLFTSGEVEKSGSHKIIVSFTTLPSRIVNLKKTINSLLNQTILPDEIVISIPELSVREKKKYIIPEFINKIIEKNKNSNYFIKTPKITILKSDKDWGPATKFIPILQREFENNNDDVVFVIVDDDQIYQRTMISNFIKYHKKFPNAILCNRGRCLDESFIYSNSKVVLGPKLDQVREVDIITGVGGYLLTLKLIDESLWDYKGAPDGAFYMDDIWLSGYFARNSIIRYSIPAQSELLFRSKRDKHQSRVFRKNKAQEKTITLSNIPCEKSDNPREYYNNEVIEYFKKYW